MFKLIGWIIYGLIVGTVVRWLYPDEPPVIPKGVLGTIAMGVAGSFIGGGINWLLEGGGPYSSSGMIMGVLGGLIFVYGYHHYLDNYVNK